ncbi:MAG: 50S ribosomal protein L11 methyltransferase [Bacteroidota bacterium]
MDFVELTAQCNAQFVEIIMAEMSVLGFNSMIETDDGFKAYIEEAHFSAQDVDEIVSRYPDAKISYSTTKMPIVNWQEEWEKHYDPVDIAGKCLIRASFHEPSDRHAYEIVINPQMSFGTGHHPTTYLMILSQLEIDHQGEKVMDVGCGTAILSIMASKLGASRVEAFDNHEWSIKNGAENIELNQCTNIHIWTGEISQLESKGGYGIILANISKNVVNNDMATYAENLREGGFLVLSGFYENDIEALVKTAATLGFTKTNQHLKEDWAAVTFKKG